MIIRDINENPLDYVLKNNLVKDGVWCEFGVFNGNTINVISNYTKNNVYGFDSFNGLPESWDVSEEITIKKGYYSYNDFAKENNLSSKLPIVNSNVILIQGYFSDTLPKFNFNKPITFIHIDCDTYNSTKDIFENINHNIANDCVIVFDEFVNYPNYYKHEYKAFFEFVEESDIQYEFIGMNGNFYINTTKLHDKNYQKVAVRIVKNPKYHEKNQ